jgi:alpha-beta hydrolase superfamily lysophospholipase
MGSISQRNVASREYINTVVCEDGYRLRYRLWPAPGLTAATMVLVNGMMSHSGWFRKLAHLLTGLQLDIVGADRRGSGVNECARGDAPSRQILLSDLRRIIEREDRGAPIYVVGWCWGALPTVNVALELGQKLSGLVLLAPGLYPSQQVRRAAQEQRIASRDADTHSPVLHAPLTEEMFSNRASVRDFIRNDCLAQRMFTPQFFRITSEMSLIGTARLSQLTQPLLLLLAANDEAVDNEQTLKALQRLRRTAVTTATLVCHHGMQFEAPQEIVSHISQWLQHDRGFAVRPARSLPR